MIIPRIENEVFVVGLPDEPVTRSMVQALAAQDVFVRVHLPEDAARFLSAMATHQYPLPLAVEPGYDANSIRVLLVSALQYGVRLVPVGSQVIWEQMVPLEMPELVDLRVLAPHDLRVQQVAAPVEEEEEEIDEPVDTSSDIYVLNGTTVSTQLPNLRHSLADLNTRSVAAAPVVTELTAATPTEGCSVVAKRPKKSDHTLEKILLTGVLAVCVLGIVCYLIMMTSSDDSVEQPVPSTAGAKIHQNDTSTEAVDGKDGKPSEGIEGKDDKSADATEGKDGKSAEATEGKDGKSAEATEGKDGKLSEATEGKDGKLSEATEGKDGKPSEATEGKDGKPSEATEGKDGKSSEATEGKGDKSSEATEGKGDKSSEATEGKDGKPTEATEGKGDKSSEATEGKDGKPTDATKGKDDKSAESTEAEAAEKASEEEASRAAAEESARKPAEQTSGISDDAGSVSVQSSARKSSAPGEGKASDTETEHSLKVSDVPRTSKKRNSNVSFEVGSRVIDNTKPERSTSGTRKAENFAVDNN